MIFSINIIIPIIKIHLQTGLGTPNDDTTPSTFGHMLSMLFQWFNATAYLPNDKTGEALEKLKSEYLPQWLQKVLFSINSANFYVMQLFSKIALLLKYFM